MTPASANIGLLTSFATLSIGLLVYFYSSRKKDGRLPLPPGPRGLPVLGNVLDIPLSEPWITYKKWANKYGDIFRLRLLGQDAIVLNSLESVKELLDQRSQNYSSRPHLAVVDMLDTSWNTGFLPYNDKLHFHRKLFHQPLHAEGVVAYRPMQLRRAHELVNRIMDDPSDYVQHFETHASSVIMSATYDYHPTSRNDPIVTKIQNAARIFVSVVTPESSAVYNAFPWLMHIPSWFPGATFQRTASSFRKALVWWLDDPFEYVLTKMSQGSLGPCIVGDALARVDANEVSTPEVQQVIKEVAATLFLGESDHLFGRKGATYSYHPAASDTTSTTLHVFVLAMTLYPEVQKRAQKEIEDVVGSDRLPDFSDRANLPYVEAVLRETLRWHPVVPLSLPHCNLSDDTYQGYRIPKGTAIIPNVWAMTRDETKYPDPLTFDPTRFFDDSGALNDDTVSYTFGFGRRICIGRHLAYASLWSAIANLLAAFVFKGPDDRDVQPVLHFTTGLTSRPEPFDVQILPRFDAEKLAALLREDE